MEDIRTVPAQRPSVVDRSTFQAQLDMVLSREKAHTREADEIAAARRRLPMVEVDPVTLLTGLKLDLPALGAEVYRGLLKAVGISVRDEYEDEGGNHYYDAVQK